MTRTPAPRWLDANEQDVWRAFVQMQGRLAARLNRELQTSSDLSLAEYEVLVRLSEAPDGDAEGAEQGQVRAFALARAMQWEKSRLSHQLTRMERRGLVERQSCPSDSRGAFVVLTNAGRAALAQAAPGHVAEVRRVLFDALTPEQVVALGEVAEVVLARLGEGTCDAPPCD